MTNKKKTDEKEKADVANTEPSTGDSQNAAPLSRTTTPEEVDGEEIGAVGPPRWHALEDLHKVLPCELLPVNSELWVKAVRVEKLHRGDDPRVEPVYVVTVEAEEGGEGEKQLTQTELHDPVLIRTLDTDASKLH